MASWLIKVKDLQGREYSVQVAGYNPGGTTVGQFKELLQTSSGILAAKQRLIFNRETLDNTNASLSQCGVGNGSLLQIVILSGWIINVHDQHNPGRVLKLFIEGHNPETKTVRDIKQEIVKVQGEAIMKLHEIRLMKYAELNDSTCLRDAGIIENDNLQMRKRSFPPWNIFIKGLTGRTHTVIITRQNPEESTVAELKKKVEEKTGLKPEEQRLCFGSKPLEDHHRFEDHNIINNSTIFLVVRMRGGAYQGMLALLRECPTRTVNNIPNVPMFRACPHCGTLLEHIDGCNNFTCWDCKKNFCFICLTLGENGKLSCGSRCNNIASRQTHIIGQH